MTDARSCRPRLWVLCAVAGAYAVVLPCAVAFGGFQAWTVRQAMLRAPDFYVAGSAGPFSSPSVAAISAFGGAFLACSLVGLPVAMIFTGLMALLERKVANARLLLFWLGAVLLLVSPLAVLSTMIFGVWWGSLPFFAFGMIGAAVAWAVRHRLQRAPR